jgi:hypothetical protein
MNPSSIYMKQPSFSAPFSLPVLRLAICALLIASANQSVKAAEPKSSKPSGATFATSAADGGRLFIRRSPLLGENVTVTVLIDGKVAGTLVKSRTLDRYLAPGSHILTASSTSGSSWRGTLDVRAGETYTYSASYNVNTIVLTRVSGSR